MYTSENMFYLQFWSIIISTLATLAIALLAWFNYKLNRTLREKDQEYKNQTTELYKKIVCATLASTYPHEIMEQNYRDLLSRI